MVSLPPLSLWAVDVVDTCRMTRPCSFPSICHFSVEAGCVCGNDLPIFENGCCPSGTPVVCNYPPKFPPASPLCYPQKITGWNPLLIDPQISLTLLVWMV